MFLNLTTSHLDSEFLNSPSWSSRTKLKISSIPYKPPLEPAFPPAATHQILLSVLSHIMHGSLIQPFLHSFYSLCLNLFFANGVCPFPDLIHICLLKTPLFSKSPLGRLLGPPSSDLIIPFLYFLIILSTFKNLDYYNYYIVMIRFTSRNWRV